MADGLQKKYTMQQLERLNTVVFKLFVFCVFFIYYDVWFVPGTIHAWLLIVGLLLLTPKLLVETVRPLLVKKSIDLEYFLLLFLLLIFIGAFAVNYSTALSINLQAYVLMIFTFVYAKESVDRTTIGFLNRLIVSYLLINGFLTVAQILVGGYTPSVYLANFQSVIASGVHDGPTKNGLITAFSLSYLYARMIFGKIHVASIEYAAFLVGVASLILAASRAGLLSFAVIAIVGLIYALVRSQGSKCYSLRKTFIVSSVAIAFLVMNFAILNGVVFRWLLTLRSQGMDSYSFAVIQYKVTTFSDDSTLERLSIIDNLSEVFSSLPLQLFSIGFGPGTYSSYFGINVHNSWLEMLFVVGIYGFVAFLVFLSYLLVGALKSKASLELHPLMFGIGSSLVFMLAHDVLRGRLIWTALGILAGVTALYLREISAKGLGSSGEVSGRSRPIEPIDVAG